MCGRFTVTTKDTKSIADRFQVELEKALAQGGAKEAAKDNPPGLGRFNVAPTQEVLVVRSSPDEKEAEEGEREARLMRWGLVPVWAKDLKVGYRMINAKTENLQTSKAYGPLVGKFRHRCLIVADGFYEWLKAEDPKQPRQPWRFTVDGGEPFAFAGLCTRKEWDDPDERGVDPDEHAHMDDSMPGMLNGTQLEKLEGAEGKAFDRLFLRYMTQHHQGALTMVQDLVDDGGGTETEIEQFILHVDSDQTIEISRMQQMLGAL